MENTLNEVKGEVTAPSPRLLLSWCWAQREGLGLEAGGEGGVGETSTPQWPDPQECGKTDGLTDKEYKVREERF